MNLGTLEYVMKFVGVPYRWNGKNPIDGFDCSGLVQEILTASGIHTHEQMNAQGIYDFLNKYPGTLSTRPIEGAVVFYGASVTEINHVAFMIDDERMIEAGGGDHTVIDRVTASAKNAFVKVRRYDIRKDIAAIILPKY